ncbi:MAG: MFS transporter [Oscillospiraceae bacterium]|nr:MFS transporter [Oscillospiraceae bacterium]
MIVLLILTYLTFIGMGLGDSMLGSAWPAMHGQFGVEAAMAGPLAMIVSGSTIVATYLSTRILRRFSTGLVLAVSLSLMSISALGFSLSGHFFVLCLLAVPLGFGAGNIDAAGNGFLAMHYSARQMSWLHCFWGVGATAGPAIMAFSLMHLSGWTMGYRVVGFLQLAVAVSLFVSLSRWKSVPAENEERAESHTDGAADSPPRTSALLRLRGARLAVLLFFVTGGMEMTLGLWGSTYLVLARGIPRDTATSWLALYYLGITVGRFLFGFLAARRSSRSIIRAGQGLIAMGALAIALPYDGFLMPGFILLGLGVAPLFPNYVHSTPSLFGKRYTQAMIGLQIVASYAGIMLMPPLFGLIGGNLGYRLFPIFVGALLAATMLIVTVLYRRQTQDSGL